MQLGKGLSFHKAYTKFEATLDFCIQDNLRKVGHFLKFTVLCCTSYTELLEFFQMGGVCVMLEQTKRLRSGEKIPLP